MSSIHRFHHFRKRLMQQRIKPLLTAAARLIGLLSVCLLLTTPAVADTLRVAVASNFTETIRELARQFEHSSNHKVTLIFGSTGKHYAQIRHGAPFDLFLAADSRRPQLLEEAGVAVPGSRFTYAVGRLLLWSPDENLIDEEASVLTTGQFRHLAAANPKLAPYGRAAQQVLQARKLWAPLRGRLVRGENIGQAFQFVRSGNAELGFIAAAQIRRPGQPMEGSWWQVPDSLHDPIEQQAVLLRDSAAARGFLDFIRSDAARQVIHSFGYGTP